jgi:catechol 2,3-dioxygenase-like lactoylglutathione lyase family enzyme
VRELEVVVVRVSDVEWAKDFYKRLGFHEAIDHVVGDGFGVVQLTPPGSACSIIFGKGITLSRARIDRVVLAVYDIDAARDELLSHGVEVSEVFHDAGGGLAGAPVRPTAFRRRSARGKSHDR